LTTDEKSLDLRRRRLVNALRAVFRMPPICQDGRGDAPA
jgi:hypothetical protein